MAGMLTAMIVAMKLKPSPVVIVTLLVILGASTAVFIALVRRETLRRKWVAMSDWGRARGMTMKDSSDSASLNSPALKIFEPFHPQPQILLESARRTFVQAGMDAPATAPVLTGKSPRHLLMLRLDSTWAPTGLRPTANNTSILDLFSLSSFPSLATNDSFMVFGSDSSAARLLVESNVAGTLPPDVGLLLHGSYLILDFSSRHFDTIEFGRMMELAEEISPRLNVAAPSRK
jgi:hypothetical protein